MYRLWMTGTRPKLKRESWLVGGMRGNGYNGQDADRPSWFDIMNRAKDREKEREISNQGEKNQEDEPMDQEGLGEERHNPNEEA